MKKIIYSITILCLMFFGVNNVLAAGSVSISAANISVPAGGTETFNITVNNAMVRAKIISNNTSVATVESSMFVNTNGEWLSDNDLKGKEKSYTITVNGVGSVGSTTTISLNVYDATSYDMDDLANTYTINVTVVDSAVTPPSVTNKYTITYNANGGNNAPSAQTKDENVALTLSTTKPTKDKHEFIGWNTKADGSGNSYDAGGTYTANENVTLYAQWKETSNVTANPNTGDSAMIIVLAIAITFGGYSYWYTKKAKEN